MFIDVIALVLIFIGFYQGFAQGLIKTLFASLSLIIAVVAALKLSPIVIELIKNTLSTNPALAFVLGFVLTFIIVMVIIRFIGNQLDGIFKKLHIGGVNKLLGGGLLGLFYALLVSLGVYFVDKVELISEETKASSYTYPVLKVLPSAAQGIGESLKPVFTDFWDQLIDTMDTIKEKGESISE